jgi:hypothetical protein
LSSRKLAAIAALVVLLIGAEVTLYMRGSTQRELQARYIQMIAAMHDKRIDALMSLLTQDYSEVRLNQKPMDRRQAELRYEQSMKAWKRIDSETFDIDAISIDSSGAKVTGERALSGLMNDVEGAFGVKGATHHMKFDTLNIDLWQRFDSGWLLQHHTIALARITVDGKLLPGGNIFEGD